MTEDEVKNEISNIKIIAFSWYSMNTMTSRSSSLLINGVGTIQSDNINGMFDAQLVYGHSLYIFPMIDPGPCYDILINSSVLNKLVETTIYEQLYELIKDTKIPEIGDSLGCSFKNNANIILTDLREFLDELDKAKVIIK